MKRILILCFVIATTIGLIYLNKMDKKITISEEQIKELIEKKLPLEKDYKKLGNEIIVNINKVNTTITEKNLEIKAEGILLINNIPNKINVNLNGDLTYKNYGVYLEPKNIVIDYEKKPSEILTSNLKEEENKETKLGSFIKKELKNEVVKKYTNNENFINMIDNELNIFINNQVYAYLNNFPVYSLKDKEGVQFLAKIALNKIELKNGSVEVYFSVMNILYYLIGLVLTVLFILLCFFGIIVIPFISE